MLLLMMMHFSFVHNMFYNYLLLCFFASDSNVTKWHQQQRERSSHENLSWEEKRRRNIFVDAIIWFISAHVCSSFRCASLCVSLFVLDWNDITNSSRLIVIYGIINSKSIISRWAIFDIGNVTGRLFFLVIKITTLKTLVHDFPHSSNIFVH